MKIKDLFEAPLPPDWDKSKFSPRTSFRQMVAYAKERAVQLGRGSSRVAFEVPYQGRPTVLKIILNRKGIIQSQEEVELFGDGYLNKIGITIPMIDFDTENGGRISWIHTEKAEKITQKQLERFFGGVSLNVIIANIEYDSTGRKSWAYQELPEHIYDNEYYDMLRDLLLNFPHIKGADLVRRSNWGVYRGTPVIIDLGFTEESSKLYR